MAHDDAPAHAALRDAARILASQPFLPPWAAVVRHLVQDGLAQLEVGESDRRTAPRRLTALL
jgi:hypothetical protein